MTSAPRTPARPVADLADAAATLRRHGGRLSAPRRRVLEALFGADGPVSAEYVAGGGEGRGPGTELTSVYRTLEHLERLGVVRHVHLGHGPGLYALARAGEREYLACERCDRVTSVPSARLDPVRAEILATFGYRARFGHFPIVGLCASCAEGEERGEPSPPHTHEHSHGDRVHAHPHVHERGLDSAHDHGH